jgi:Domain of unknown function (DUF4115)
MSPLLVVVFVGGAIVLTLRSARGRRGDHHSLETHHRALVALGEIARQDDQPPRAHPPHVRVEPPVGRPSKGVGRRIRRPAHRPLAPPPHLTPAPEPAEVVEPPAGAEHGRPIPRGNDRPPSVDAGSDDVAAEAREAAAFPPAEPPRAGFRTRTVPEAPTLPLPTPPQPWPVMSSQPADRPAGVRDDTAVGPTSEPARSAPLDPVTPRPMWPDPGGSRATGTVANATRTARGARRHRRYGARRPSNRPRYLRFGAAAVVVATVALVGFDRWGPYRSRPAAPASRPAASLPAPPSPQTTPPPPAAAVLISGDSHGARYQVPPSAEIELVTSSPCWLQIRTGSVAGPILFEGVLRPGDRKLLPSPGPLWLRLGNPAGVAVIVNSNTLHLAGSSSGQPYNLELRPAA